jgi:hypothetical protein
MSGVTVQVHSLIIGAVVLAGGVWLGLDYRGTARWIHGYYTSRPQINARPRWVFKQFRPSETQARFWRWCFQ